MNKARWNLALDGVLALTMLAEVVSGFVLWVVLPRVGGYRGGRGVEAAREFIVGRSTWLALHDWGAVVLTAGIVAHIILHRKWIACMLANLWRGARGSFTAVKPVSNPAPRECSN